MVLPHYMALSVRCDYAHRTIHMLHMHVSFEMLHMHVSFEMLHMHVSFEFSLRSLERLESISEETKCSSGV